jgi:hypothetical protein
LENTEGDQDARHHEDVFDGMVEADDRKVSPQPNMKWKGCNQGLGSTIRHLAEVLLYFLGF